MMMKSFFNVKNADFTKKVGKYFFTIVKFRLNSFKQFIKMFKPIFV